MIYSVGKSVERRADAFYLRVTVASKEYPELVTTFRLMDPTDGSSDQVVDAWTVREPVPVPPGRLQKRWQGGRWEQLTRKGWVAV